MKDVFITQIQIEKVRHLRDLDIVLSDTERKHLILTGKNGSGKTSLLDAMRHDILIEQHLQKSFSTAAHAPHIKIKYFGRTEPYGDKDIFVYIAVSRNKPNAPIIIEPVHKQGNKRDKTRIDKTLSKDFLQYILNLYVQYLGEKDSGGGEKALARYRQWFDNFTEALRYIYDCPELTLKPNMRTYSFEIIMPGREPFKLHEMSDGYAAFIDIYMELLMRFERGGAEVAYDTPAIVLIDEIETHLHVELQKRVLPFLTRVFPRVQFIVATHSPFVVTSLENAVVFDLETGVRLPRDNDDATDLTQYSYTDIVEGYFDESECSGKLEADFGRYVTLVSQTSRTAEEREETRRLFERLHKIPGTSPLSTAFYRFERGRKNGTAN